MTSDKSRNRLSNAAVYLVIVVLIPVIVLFFISEAMQLQAADVVGYFFFSTIGSVNGLLSVLDRTTILLILAAGLLIAFRCSIWNIGAEGQMAVGIVGALGVSLFLPLPGPALIIFGFLVSFILGGLWGSIAGFLKAKWEVNEIPITLMQNFVALALLDYMVRGPWRSPEVALGRTPFIPDSARLPFIEFPLNSALLIGLGLVPVAYWLLNRTLIGYKLQAAGMDRAAVLFAGIDVKRTIISSMFISAALAGIGGASLVFGEFFMGQSMMTGNYGFYAIIPALLVGTKVEFLPFACFLTAVILVGALNLSLVGVPARFTLLLMGAIFLGMCLPVIFQRRRKR